IDLSLRQGFHALVFRAQAQVNFRQRQRRRGPGAGGVPAKIPPLPPHGPATIAFGSWRAASRPGRAATITARAVIVPSRSGRTIATGRAGTTAIAVAAAVKSLGFAFVFGILGGGRLLRPGGQEE